MSDIEHNKQLARDFFNAMSTFDAAALKKILADDVIFTIPGTSCVSRTYTQETAGWLIGLVKQACPDGIQFNFKDVTAEDDRVALVAEGHAKTKDGGEYNNHYHFLFKIRDGKICNTYEYMDTLLIEKLLSPFVNKAAD